MYYSTYHRALEWAQTNGYTKAVGESYHSSLWRWIGGWTIQGCADKGGQAHDYRVLADYQSSDRFDLTDYNEAWDFMEKLHKLLASFESPWPGADDLRATAKATINAKMVELWPPAKPKPRSAT